MVYACSVLLLLSLGVEAADEAPEGRLLIVVVVVFCHDCGLWFAVYMCVCFVDDNDLIKGR